MLCVTSFTVVLTLGGGPRRDHAGGRDLPGAALRLRARACRGIRPSARSRSLSWPSGCCRNLVVTRHAKPTRVSARRYLTPSWPETIANAALILLAAFVLGPLAAIVVSGLGADLGRLATEASVQRAALTSLVLAAISALLAVLISLALTNNARRALQGNRRVGRRSFAEYLADTGPGFVLVVPPIVIGAGWFVLMRHAVDVFRPAPVMVVAVNAAMAMPFVIRAIRPASDSAAARHDRLAASLGITGWNRFGLVDWPSIRGPLATGFAFAMALSLWRFR